MKSPAQPSEYLTGLNTSRSLEPDLNHASLVSGRKLHRRGLPYHGDTVLLKVIDTAGLAVYSISSGRERIFNVASNSCLVNSAEIL